MTSKDTGKIVQLLRDVYLAVAVAFYDPDNHDLLIVDYSDMKPHRSTGEPRLQTTHMDAMYALMKARGGVEYGMRTGVSPHPGLQRLVFLKHDLAVTR